VNDKHGHAVGDKLIISIARVIEDSLRETDVLARYGGDEFVVILTETPHDRAIEVAERIRAAVENTSFSAAGERVSSTISVGVSSFTQDAEQQDGIMIRADKKLYESKRKGKNTVSH
jgi:diguanylate cyclase (GGDEF)-like protein